MARLALGTNTAIFIIFFGISFLDALTSGNLLRSAFWAGIGLFFLSADILKSRKRT